MSGTRTLKMKSSRACRVGIFALAHCALSVSWRVWLLLLREVDFVVPSRLSMLHVWCMLQPCESLSCRRSLMQQAQTLATAACCCVFVAWCVVSRAVCQASPYAHACRALTCASISQAKHTVRRLGLRSCAVSLCLCSGRDCVRAVVCTQDCMQGACVCVFFDCDATLVLAPGHV